MYGKDHAITHSGLKKTIEIAVKTAQKKSAFEPTFHIVLIIIINDDVDQAQNIMKISPVSLSQKRFQILSSIPN